MQSPPQITTVFSINPSTNEPYITVEVAMNVIKYHLFHRDKNILNYKLNSMEDLVQNILLCLCKYAYNPTLSAPKTFIIMVAKHRVGNIIKWENTYDKNLEGSDFVVNIDDEQGPKLATEVYSPQYNITPEDVLLANEFANEFFEKGQRKANSSFRTFPKGWTQQRNVRKPNFKKKV